MPDDSVLVGGCGKDVANRGGQIVRTIGIVIRTLNESELIGRCLEILHRQEGPFELDILVVDSGSTDATLEIARAHGARIVELPPSDFDYSTALNTGIDRVEGDVIMSLSAHAIPLDEHWLQRMTVPFEDGRVAGVASRQIPWPNAPWHEVQRLQDQFGNARRVYSAADLGEIVFSNAASGISRSVWRDEPFTLPAVEDIEWARRVVSAGWTIVYEPEAGVYHSHAESARAQARRLIDIGRVADGEDALRGNRRTLREACGFVYRNFKAIFALDEALRQKIFHLVYVLRVACYYVLDFSRSGTTAERRREDGAA